MQTNWIYALIAVIIIGAGAAYLLTKSPSAATTGSQTSDNRQLKTYYDERYGMAFNFPDSYDVSDKEVSATHHTIVLADKASATVPANSDGAPTITVDVFSKPSTLVADKWIKATKDSNYVEGTQLADTKIAEIPAFAYAWDGLYTGTSFVFPHSGRIYMMSVTYNSPNDQIYKDFAGVIASVQLDP